MIKKVVLVIGLLFVIGCTQNSMFFSYQSIANNSWKKNHPIIFNVNTTDTVTKHNIFIHIRNNDTYPFSNLFLITKLKFPNGQNIIDTLQYQMATPNGEWLGKGVTSVKENKLWYKENIKFPVKGTYQIDIEQAMRKNGEVNGLPELTGITDVGLEIKVSQ